MRTVALLLSILLLSLPAFGQRRGNPKVQFRSMVKAAKSDPEALLEAAKFAQRNKLTKQANKLLRSLLKKHPEHAGINEAAGRVQHGGKWMDAKKADKLIAADLAKKYRDKGLVEVSGLWVGKDEVDDAKKGIFHHDGDVVNRWEKQRLLQGWIRHPQTGTLVKGEHAQKIKDGQFPLKDGKWGDQKAADEYHASLRSPWIVRSDSCLVVSNLPLETIKYKILTNVDQAISRLLPVFGGNPPHPTRRPIVQVIAKSGEYQRFGERFGGGGSAHGAFLSANMVMKVMGVTNRVGVAHWEKSWGPFYARHAAGLALCNSFLFKEWQDVPIWFPRACGGYVERHFQNDHAKHFGKQHRDKGGVKRFAKWLDRFEISSELPARGFGSIDYNVYQAGLVMSFCMRGGDKDATAALQAVTDAVRTGKKAGKAVKGLEKVLSKKEKAVQDYFQKIIG